MKWIKKLFSQNLGESPFPLSPFPLSLSIPRVDGYSLTPEIFFEQYQQHNQPVIITGLLKGEAEWNLDYLCEHIGSEIFPVRQYQQQGVGSGVASENMRFKDYANLLRTSAAKEKSIYLGKCNLSNTSLASSPILQQAEAKIGLSHPVTSLNLWLGLGGHTTSLHYDPFDGTLIQLYGSKQVVLFPPSQLYNLYPLAIMNHLWHGSTIRANHSKVNIKHPDFVSFPNLEQAFLYQYNLTLNQGEILYIPAGWWHEVTLLGEHPVCSVNRWWRVFPRYRAISWSRWRVFLGSFLAIPHTLTEGLSAIVSGDRQQKLKQLLQKL